MQLTILSSKLPNQSTPEYTHEFRVVHATETKKMAHSLGIISQYTQGLTLRSAMTSQETFFRNQPLPVPKGEPIESFAQLTWPGGLKVMQGSFTTQGYKESAGKHIFAVPRIIYLTDRLEPAPVAVVASRIKNAKDAVRLIVGLTPQDNNANPSNFRKSWDKHASFCRAICPHYQRNQVRPLTSEHIQKIFTDTQFPAGAVVHGVGGYEEFVFENHEAVEVFCERYGEELRESYAGFAATTGDGGRSFCLAVDVVVQYDEEADRGYLQVIVGAVVGMMLRLKVYFGV